MEKKIVGYWLFLGLAMIFMQVIIGGITRLTGSGLSITKWEIVTGTIPPITTDQWEAEFALYKETPQYQKLNAGMSMSEFKFIYFWEYFHRLWARSMGFVFLIPLFVFWRRKWIEPWLLKRLAVIFVLAATVGLFGWIMVASGLIDRPWVSAYKLSVHLLLAVLLISYVWWTVMLFYRYDRGTDLDINHLRWFVFLLFFQIVLGGMMSGMKAALVYPSFPDFDGLWFPGVLLNADAWSWENVLTYDKSAFMPALIQLLHRTMGYILFIWTAMILWHLRKLSYDLRKWSRILMVLVLVQVLLGIMVLISAIGTIPLWYGVAHQAVAILVLLAALRLQFSVGGVRAVVS